MLVLRKSEKHSLNYYDKYIILNSLNNSNYSRDTSLSYISRNLGSVK